MIMNERLNNALAGHLRMVREIESSLKPRIEETAKILVQALRQGNKALVMGNGGSAADAQHLAAELVGRFLTDRRPLPAIALTTDTSILTAVGNDYGFDDIFVRQVEALARPGDVLIGISTSGNSMNVISALKQGRSSGCRTVGLTGGEGGTINGIVDLSLVVPARETPRVQEGHILIIHILCDLVEREFL